MEGQVAALDADEFRTLQITIVSFFFHEMITYHVS